MTDDQVEHLAKRVKANHEPKSRPTNSEFTTIVETYQGLSIEELFPSADQESLLNQSDIREISEYSGVMNEYVLIAKLTPILVSLHEDA